MREKGVGVLVVVLLESLSTVVQFVLKRIVVVATLPFENGDAIQEVVLLLFGLVEFVVERRTVGCQRTNARFQFTEMRLEY